MKQKLNNKMMSFLKRAFLAVAVLMTAMGIGTSCSKDMNPVGMGNGQAIGFSMYAPMAATRGEVCDTPDVLGRWDSSNSTFEPGLGIGVFAFYQKAKSNGYPVNFNKYSGDPNYMYNQHVERTTSDGLNYCFNYSPVKYWPNNSNDQISFFAYAPYDVTEAWEDLNLSTDLNGTRITRQYIIEPDVEDQRDFLWANPVLNVKNTDISGPVQFEFKHLCARISVTAVANYTPYTPYLTVDTLAITSNFYTSGTLLYNVAASTTQWKSLTRAGRELTYYPFREDYSYNSALGRDTSNAIRITNTESLAHPEEGYMFVLPGTQDITFHYAISQRNPTTGDVFTHHDTKSFPMMQLEAGKAYNFKLNVTIEPISIASVTVISVDLAEVTQNIP